MATYTTALITSRLSVEEVAMMLHSAGHAITNFDVTRNNYIRNERRFLSAEGQVHFKDYEDLVDKEGKSDPNGHPRIRTAGVISCAKMSEYVDETGYKGPGTIVSLGCTDNSKAILTRVLERSGGGMLNDDLSEDGWVTVPGTMTVTPEQRKNAGIDLVTLSVMIAMHRTAFATGLNLEFASASPDGLRVEDIREQVQSHVKTEDVLMPGPK